MDKSRNPLKSGQCFLHKGGEVMQIVCAWCKSQSPQIGSMFLTWFKHEKEEKALKRMSQSPQIGSMFLTKTYFILKVLKIKDYLVAIPSNRVNVSYFLKGFRYNQFYNWCRNPLKSGQCFLQAFLLHKKRRCRKWKRRNPLKSGQCFLPYGQWPLWRRLRHERRRNPLKSGQCFLQKKEIKEKIKKLVDVAIPSNRVNVSYWRMGDKLSSLLTYCSRNPLKSGQCFLLIRRWKYGYTKATVLSSQSPQIGSMFLTYWEGKVIVSQMILSRNPLKSGQCFLLGSSFGSGDPCYKVSRNPLKSGQCFLRID